MSLVSNVEPKKFNNSIKNTEERAPSTIEDLDETLFDASNNTHFNNNDFELPLTAQANKVGDLDNDGDVDGDDLKILKEYLEGKHELNESSLKEADVNHDGTIDYKDLTTLMYTIVERREAEDRVRDLQQLYEALMSEQTAAHIVSGVDNLNIASVKSELDTARANLNALNKLVSGI